MRQFRAFLDELLAQLKALKTALDHAKWADWNKRAAQWKTRYDVVTDEHRKPEGLVSIYNLAEVIGTESKIENFDAVPVNTLGLPIRPRQGEKGIGRLSVAFLAPGTVLVSKRPDSPFVVVAWQDTL